MSNTSLRCHRSLNFHVSRRLEFFENSLKCFHHAFAYIPDPLQPLKFVEEKITYSVLKQIKIEAKISSPKDAFAVKNEEKSLASAFCGNSARQRGSQNGQRKA